MREGTNAAERKTCASKNEIAGDWKRWEYPVTGRGLSASGDYLSPLRTQGFHAHHVSVADFNPSRRERRLFAAWVQPRVAHGLTAAWSLEFSRNQVPYTIQQGEAHRDFQQRAQATARTASEGQTLTSVQPSEHRWHCGWEYRAADQGGEERASHARQMISVRSN